MRQPQNALNQNALNQNALNRRRAKHPARTERLTFDNMRFPLQHRPRTVVLSLTFGLALAGAATAVDAQTHHVDAPQRVTRALGVYEWTGDLAKPTAARFVPVSLYIEGTLQDAGLYLARPVPFALGAGDVYSLEHAGEPEGLLDLGYAQRVVTNRAAGEDAPGGGWYGFGQFTPLPPEKPVAPRPSSRLPVVQTDGKSAATADDSRPHMTRRGESTTPAPATGDAESKSPKTNPTDAGARTGETGAGGTASGADDPDRPTLRHRDPSQDATRKREYGTRAKQASVTAAGPGPGDDPDRPVLGRASAADAATPPLTGLPANMHQMVGVSDPVHREPHDFARAWDTPAERSETMAKMEAVGRSRVASYLAANGLVPSAFSLPAETPPETAPQAGGAPVAAASPSPAPASGTDAGLNAGSPDRSPDRSPDSSTDAGDAGAPPQLKRGIPTQYGTPRTPTPTPAPAQTPTPVPPAPPTASPAGSPAGRSSATRLPTNRRSNTGTKTGAKGGTKAGANTRAAPVLKGSTIAGYTLSFGGLPTFIYTAAVPVVPSRPGPRVGASGHAATSAAGVQATVWVTIVAQRLPSGELQVALSSVTDALHLDRDPRLRLIDAVDPDDSHRASLLFELRGASSRQFALFRLASARAEQIFTTASLE